MLKSAAEKAKKGAVLGRLELTQQPERTFYKDEGGAKVAYLFCFFVLRAARTEELKSALSKVENGHRKIPIKCELVRTCSDDPIVDDTKEKDLLVLLGSSNPSDGDVFDGTPEFDAVTFTGSVRFRISKGMNKANAKGCRLRVSLEGLENVIESATTEKINVLSKRKKLRKKDRIPEQRLRMKIENAARERNFEVERKLARTPPSSTLIIHQLSPDTPGFTHVPQFPKLHTGVNGGAHVDLDDDDDDDDDDEDEAYVGTRKKRRNEGEASSSKKKFSKTSSSSEGSTNAKVEALEHRVKALEQHLKGIEQILFSALPQYTPQTGVAASSSSTKSQKTSKKQSGGNLHPVPQTYSKQSSIATLPKSMFQSHKSSTPNLSQFGNLGTFGAQVGDKNALYNSLPVWESFSQGISKMFQHHQQGPTDVTNDNTSAAAAAAVAAAAGATGGATGPQGAFTSSLLAFMNNNAANSKTSPSTKGTSSSKSSKGKRGKKHP